jgi:uncharacterized protein DUF3307
LPDIVITILLLFCLLQIKHMFADFFLQTRRMLSGRSTYLHVGRAQHAGVHALLSIPAFLVIGTGYGFVLAVIVAEWVVHFHLDWAKARYSEVRALNPSQARFWGAFGVDQALHQLTYIVMVWAWVYYAA